MRYIGGEPESPDVKPSDRVWYRNALTGQRGYLVQVGGKDKIRLDRPVERIELNFRPDEWLPEQETRPLNSAQVAQVAYVADRELARMLGFHDQARVTWLSLTEQQRIDWINKGPTGLARRRLFDAVFEALKGLSG